MNNTIKLIGNVHIGARESRAKASVIHDKA